MTTRNLILSLIAAVLTLIAAPRASDACSCAFSANWGFLASDKGVMPKNATVVFWTGTEMPKVEDFGVARVAGKREVVLKVELVELGEDLWLVKPKEGLEVGQTYRFSTKKFNGFRKNLTMNETGGQSLELKVVDEELHLESDQLRLEAKPIAVGEVHIAASMSCTRPLNVPNTTVALVLPEAAREFAQLLVYTTLIDGQATWRPRSSLCQQLPAGRTWAEAPGVDRLFAGCSQAKEGLAEGKHQVQIQAAFFPAEPKAALSKPLDLDFSCKGAKAVQRGVRFP